MEKVTIYTAPTCPYCKMAKELLTSRGYNYEEKQVDFGSKKLEDLIKKTKHTTVPQIFFNEEFIGGYDDLVKYLDNQVSL